MPQLLQSEDEFSLVVIQKYWPCFNCRASGQCWIVAQVARICRQALTVLYFKHFPFSAWIGIVLEYFSTVETFKTTPHFHRKAFLQ